jgi:hypothetical protein
MFRKESILKWNPFHRKEITTFFPDLLSETLVWFQERVSCTSLGKGNPALPFAG